MMRAHRGFSLIEMALVLMVVTLLLGGLLVPFATQVEQRRIAETQKAMEEIKEALVGFALSRHASATQRPYLPCPDTDGDGKEDRTGSGCTLASGNLPWADLGTAPADAWGNRFHYSVDAVFSNNANGFELTSVGTLTVCDSQKPAASVNCTTEIASTLPALVLSYGKNGYGALNANGGFNQPPTSLDEIENTRNDADLTIYVSHTITTADTGAGEFDDLVVWLSPNVLFNRLVAAGRLP